MLNSTSPTTLVFPVEDLGGLQLQGKALHGLLSSSPFFLKAPLRGEGRAARCLLAECLWSSCRQAGRTSWSRTLQAGCGVHPLPGGRQQLAQGARPNWRAAETDSIPAPAKPQAPSLTSVSASLWMLGAAVEGEKSGPIQSRRTKAAIFFSKSAAARRGMRCALLTCEVPVELVTPNRTSWSRTLQVGCGRLPPPG